MAPLDTDEATLLATHAVDAHAAAILAEETHSRLKAEEDACRIVARLLADDAAERRRQAEATPLGQGVAALLREADERECLAALIVALADERRRLLEGRG
jgi:hypothetical protein